jgi:hypothetical protein
VVRRAMKRQQTNVTSLVGCPLRKKQRGSDVERHIRKRQHELNVSSPLGCPLSKRQRDQEQQGNCEIVESDILVLDIDEFTIRLFDEILKM